jgi:hypothetical protein
MARNGDNTCLCGKVPRSGRPAFQVKLVALVLRCFRWNQGWPREIGRATVADASAVAISRGWPKHQAPTSKLQRISKHQVSNRFSARLPVARRKASQWCRCRLELAVWSFSGAWNLVLGASLPTGQSRPSAARHPRLHRKQWGTHGLSISCSFSRYCLRR